MLEKLYENLRKKKETIYSGDAKKIEKQHNKGKMTARERLNFLFDKDSFTETNVFVKSRCTNFGLNPDKTICESVITGYGYIGNKIVCAFSQDFTNFGGALGEMHAKKIVDIMDLAAKIGAPIIGLNDSGGAKIQEAVDALSGYGDIFYRNAIYSGYIPQISVIMGPCAGGAVYSPALTDFIFMVNNTSQMFITGPQVIKTVTNEEISAEDLGGAETNNNLSGNAHFIANNDKECLLKVKSLIKLLPSNNLEIPIDKTEKEFSMEFLQELNSIIPDHADKSYNVKDVIRYLVDDNDIFEYQEGFAQNAVTCFGKITGKTVGIVANQPKFAAGCLDIHSSDKIARFIRTCDAFNIPLITLVDVPGFLPGSSQEHNGVIRHGAKILYAYSEATVPKITVILRKAYGGAYVAMCSKSLGADSVLAWPSAEIAVMGAKGAVNIIFKKDIDNAENKEEVFNDKVNLYNSQFATPYKAAERGFVDDVITPSETRQRIIYLLSILKNKREKKPAKKHGNIPL